MLEESVGHESDAVGVGMEFVGHRGFVAGTDEAQAVEKVDVPVASGAEFFDRFGEESPHGAKADSANPIA